MCDEAKRQKIIDTVKDLGTATAAEISALTGVSVNVIRDVMNDAMIDNPNIRVIRGKGYIWGEPTKHPEGHTDLTPYLAMMEEIAESRFTDGAVYVRKYGVTGVVGECGLFLVLKGFENTVCGFDVYTTEHKYFDRTRHITFDNNGREYYIQPERVISVSPSKLEDCQFYLLTEKISEIKTAVIARLSLDPKIKFLPAIDQSGAIQYLKDSGWLKAHDDAIAAAVQIREAPISVLEADPNIEVIKRERDIWREAFFAVCGKAPCTER